MSRKIITSLIILMSISLIGIIGVQILWIKNAVQIQEQTFDSNINKVLHKIVTNLEKEESIFLITKGLHFIDSSKLGNIEIHKIKEFIDGKNPGKKHHIQIKTTQKLSGNQHHVISSNTQFIVSGTKQKTQIIKFRHPKSKLDSLINIDIQLTTNDTIIRSRKKEKQIENIFEKVIYEFNSKDITIKERISEEDLPNEIKKSLNSFNINTNFNYAIVDGKTNKVVISSDSSLNSQLIESSHQVNLFPNDIFLSNHQLVLLFTDQFNLIHKSIFPLLILSVIFTLFIVFTFINAIFFILKQKRISDIKSDFINNITHEFKTPIATIALASDSINNPKIIGEPDRIRYFTSIIKDENYRMNKQVENILQLSLFGKHELDINPQTNNVNEILQKAGEHIQLQIDEKGGNLKINLQAINDIADIDEVHFLNTIFNLLDNSIKYSIEKPDIEIGTKNQDNKIHIWIKDSGIGMNQKTKKKVFRKFFRAETGNIHNVKGFGLGLSYVKLIIEKHNGHIDIISKPNQGTTVNLTLPLKS
ncbi:MAG: HAMP domain-containing histidine kinase [Labilibaculum sp.]|nr:HAMP domain-containing histidine kinase [Labilibaculum sp.]